MVKFLQRVLTSSILALLLANTSFAQAQLVKDINTAPANALESGRTFCQCGDYLFFAANTEKGRELWRTDGTSVGTIPLGDINKGILNGYAKEDMVCDQNNILYFTGDDGLHGFELWKSDGTTAGTKMVKDVTPGNNSFYNAFSSLGLIGNTLYFIADHDADNNFELWKSDGTGNSTVEVGVPGFPGSISPYVTFKSDTHLYFTIFNQSTQKFELWVTDGTVDNTAMLLEDHWINVSQAFGNEVHFVAINQSAYTYSLWSSGGTIASTTMIKDFGGAYIEKLLKFGNKSVLSVQGNAWISDGSAAGTVMIPSVSMNAGTTIGDHFYGIGYNYATSSYSVFKTDGTFTENFDVDVTIGELSFLGDVPVFGNKLVVAYEDQVVGREIGLFDISSQTATLLKDINPGTNNSSPNSWGSLNGRVYFLADDGSRGVEIWATDGTGINTQLLKEINKGTQNAFHVYAQIEVAVSDGKLQLIAQQQNSTAIFASDGSEGGTTSKFQFLVNQGYLFGKVGDELIYHSDRKFYKTRGSSDDVTLVKDLTSDLGGYGYTHRQYNSLDGKLIFQFHTSSGNIALGSEFWVTDGTESGTKVLKDINPGVANGVSGENAIAGLKLIFDGTHPAHGAELWITDGTEDGTVLLKDINPGADGSTPAGFVTLGDKVIFAATDANHGKELWITDGTEQGTKLLADIVPGPTGSDVTQLNASGHLVFFSAYDSDRGWTLWKTDGTTEGTMLVKDIMPSSEKYYVMANMKVIGNRLFFAADDGEHGMELWVSDGTQAGTHLIDILPGAASSIPSLFYDINGVVYFKADAALWRTNGTSQGTSKVSELEPLSIVQLDNWVYFTAPHPDYGIELFKVEFAKLDQQITFEPITTKTFGEDPFQLRASASSGLPLTISSEEEISLTNQTASIVKPGTVSITVAQPGDALYNPAEATQTLCILPAKPTISVTNTAAGQSVLTSSSNEGNHWYFDNAIVDNADEKSFVAEESGLYKVNVVIDNCVSVFSDGELIVITGTETVDKSIRFYPNPVVDNLKIETTGDTPYQLTLLDLQGKPLNTFALDGNTLVDYSTRSLPPGIYLIKIISEQKISYEKFVKE